MSFFVCRLISFANAVNASACNMGSPPLNVTLAKGSALITCMMRVMFISSPPPLFHDCGLWQPSHAWVHPAQYMQVLNPGPSTVVSSMIDSTRNVYLLSAIIEFNFLCVVFEKRFALSGTIFQALRTVCLALQTAASLAFVHLIWFHESPCLSARPTYRYSICR